MHIITLPKCGHRIVAADTMGHPIDRLSKVLTRKDLYWVDSPDRGYVSVYTPAGRWVEYPDSGVLMASPLDGGPPRRIAAGMRAIDGNDSAIWWERLRPSPDSQTDLHYYIPGTGESGKVLGFGTNSIYQDRYPVGHRNRIYWLSAPEKDGASTLHSANPGKTSPDIVLRFPPGSWIDPGSIHSNGRILWVVRGTAKLSAIPLYRTSGERIGGPESALPDVAVIDSERGRIVANSGPINGPNASIRAVEQDFVYYSTRELRRHTLDFLSHEDTMRDVYCLYRARLNSVK